MFIIYRPKIRRSSEFLHWLTDWQLVYIQANGSEGGKHPSFGMLSLSSFSILIYVRKTHRVVKLVGGGSVINMFYSV